MGATKSPGRVIDGPFASWDGVDENCKITLTANSTIKLGQPVSIDVTQLGPDNNVPNNGAALPLCEIVVATTSANAGPCFGVVSQVLGNPSSLTLSLVNGVPTWKNTSGSTVTVPILVRQQGWGYVWAGTAAIGQTGGNSILVGSTLITTTAQAFAIQGTAAIKSTIGIALATAINTTQQVSGTMINSGTAAGAAAAAGVISVVPQSLVGIVPTAMVLIDVLGSGVQEAVSVGSISYPTFSVAVANAHAAGYKVTGPNALPAVNSVLISTPGAGVVVSGLVATWINVFA